MNISTNIATNNPKQIKNAIKPIYTEKISKDEVKEIRTQLKQNSLVIALNVTNIQITLSKKQSIEQQYAEFQTFLKDIGYEGKPIAELSQGEASALVAEDGFFGIEQTSDRIANFVIDGSGGDANLMRAGREGMLQGFKDAEVQWGGKLPEISQETMKAAIQKVDKAMVDLGFSILDTEV